LDNETVPEFQQAKFSDWDTLLKEAADFKGEVYKELRTLSEPKIKEYISKL
jgi:hypothetical protein